MIGARIGRYLCTRLLGEGGMGAVYQGVDEQIDRQVAIKVLRPQYAQMPEVTARFLTEARAANVIKHPNIVQVHEFGTLPDGTAYMVMEYLEGMTLSQRLRQSGPALPEDDAVHIAWQIASSLEAAHARSIVHRDLKPSNVMLIPDPAVPGGERVKLLDFGIAKVLNSEKLPEGPRTRTGAVIGTPLYMSPEQCRGDKELDGQSDVYSLGVLLFQMLVGAPPFQADGDGALIAMHIYEPPPLLAEQAKNVSEPIALAVDAALQKDRRTRPTMRQLAETLRERNLESLPGLSRRSNSYLRLSPPDGAGPPQAPGPQPSPLGPTPASEQKTAPQSPSTTGLGLGQIKWADSQGRGRRLAIVATLGLLACIGASWLYISLQSPTTAKSSAASVQDLNREVTLRPSSAAEESAPKPRPSSSARENVAPPRPVRSCPNGFVAVKKTGQCVRKQQRHGQTKLMVD